MIINRYLSDKRPNRKSEQTCPTALSSTPTVSLDTEADQTAQKIDMRKKKRSLGVDMRERLSFFRKPTLENAHGLSSGSAHLGAGLLTPGGAIRTSLATSPNFMANLDDVWRHTGGPPSRDQILSWNQSFENLLHDQHGITLFFEFLRSEFSDENLEFWAECQAYRSINCPARLQQKATQIFEDYVAEQSPREINIDSVTRLQTSSDIEKATVTTFDQSQKKIQALMEKDSYQRFLRSELYHGLLQQYKIQQHNPQTTHPNSSIPSSSPVASSSTLSNSKVSYLPGLLPRVTTGSRNWNYRANTNPSLLNTMRASDIGSMVAPSTSIHTTTSPVGPNPSIPIRDPSHRSAPSSPKNKSATPVSTH